MSAPAFCTVTLLTADLHKLGYPDADNPKVLQSDGAARIDLLMWLAQEMDPTVDLGSVEQVALFWDNLGVHSAYPSATGHRVPFTAPNRAHDRAAAYVFLRAAVDLVLAVRRLRAPGESPHWLSNPPSSEPHSRRQSSDAAATTQLDCFDTQCFAQLDALIQQRHSLFPSTNRLFSDAAPAPASALAPAPAPASVKRAPLAIRSASSINISKSTPSIESSAHARFKSKTPKKPPASRKTKPSRVAEAGQASCPAREHVLDRLRTLRGELADLVTTAARPQQAANEDEALASLDLSVARTLATSAASVRSLSSRVDSIVDDAHAVRTVHARSAKRDVRMETQVTVLAPCCAQLVSSVNASLTAVAKVRSAIKNIRKGTAVLDALPSSPVIRSVEQQQLRAECHL